MSPYVTTPPGEKTPVIQHRAWWKEASVYQIYPASFCDSNSDGIGDLPGIISKLDYIKSLGVDVVWLSPILESPQRDMGYDISDYKNISSQYGNLKDVEDLVAGLHARGIKFLMDLVVNHTSDQHAWFKQSRSSKNNKFRDWYIWKKPQYNAEGIRQPPNNWKSFFQGSAWEWDETTQEYYLHLFCKEQPDLNWENPAVRAAAHDIMRFWLDRGADGFRMDVINYISKDQSFADGTTEKQGTVWHVGAEHYAAGPRLHEYLKELGAILKEYNAFSVGEMPFVRDPKDVIKAVQYDREELNMIFQFDVVDIDHGMHGKFMPKQWPLIELKKLIEKWQVFMHANGGWNALFLENHDQPRSVSRFTSDCPEHVENGAKMLATLLGCQAGTLFVYQGQELGMSNVPEEWDIDMYRDIDTLNHWSEINSATTDPKTLKIARAEYQKKSRDNARTPMQWTSGPYAGFTDPKAEPWIAVNSNHDKINATSQTKNPCSVFSYWTKVLMARKEHKDIIVYGNFTMLTPEDENVLAYTRESEAGQTILVLCNFSPETRLWGEKLPVVKGVALSSYERDVDYFGAGEIYLSPYEACALLI